jgi:hypothetical protein
MFPTNGLGLGKDPKAMTRIENSEVRRIIGEKSSEEDLLSADSGLLCLG